MTRASDPEWLQYDEPRDRRERHWFWIAGAGIAILFVVPKIFQHATLQTGDLDTGNYSNLAWAILHGEGFSGSVLGRHHLGEHFSPIMALVAPLYLLWSSAYVLMLLQGAAVVVTILLVLRMARSRGAGALTFFLFALFLFYPPLLSTWKTQFQPIELGMPLVVIAVLLLRARRDAWLGLIVLLLLMTRESAPLAVLGLAIYAGIALRRWRAAVTLALIAGIWAGLVFGVIMPHFRADTHWAHERWFGPGEMWRPKTLYLAVVFLALGPLPFIGRDALAATAGAIPGVLLNLSVARETQISFVGHYDAQIAPFLMIAAAHGIVALQSSRLHLRARLAVVVGSIIIEVILFSRSGTRTPVEALARWWPDRTSLDAAREARAVALQFSDAPSISATSRLGPQVCHRRHYMAMRCGTTSRSWLGWASNRLAPGTILLIPTEALDDEVAERTLVRNSGRAERVYAGRYVEAWRWPTDAPAPGSAGAEAYVQDGMKPKQSRSKARR